MSRPDASSPDRSTRTGVTLASDTSIEAQRVQVELWRRMSPLEKARTVSAITLAAQQFSLAGIRLRHPRASNRECMLRLAILKLGRELTYRVYPDAATILGGDRALREGRD